MDRRCAQKGHGANLALAVRTNIALIFRGVVSRKKMKAYGIAGQRTLSVAKRHHEENGMTAYLVDYKRGRAGVDADMLRKIQQHVMDPKNDFTKVLPFGKSKVPDARALIVTKNEVYDSFPYKKEISLDAFSKLICNSKNGATPNLRAWLHETDMCKTCPQRKNAVADLRTYMN